MSSEYRGTNDDRRWILREYEVNGRNQVSRRKTWKESGFESGETGFVQLRCKYGTMVMERRNECSGCIHSLVSLECIMEGVSLGDDGRKCCI